MNQNPEQIDRDNIDKQLLACGWVVQDKFKINLSVGMGIAVGEYQADIHHTLMKNPLKYGDLADFIG